MQMTLEKSEAMGKSFYEKMHDDVDWVLTVAQFTREIITACQAEADEVKAAVQAERESIAFYVSQHDNCGNTAANEIRSRGDRNALDEALRNRALEVADDIFQVMLASDRDQPTISWMRRYIDDLAYIQPPQPKGKEVGE